MRWANNSSSAAVVAGFAGFAGFVDFADYSFDFSDMRMCGNEFAVG
ncbi:MAG: hypothetical protein LKF49_00555 [Bifidobacterium tibiigranuli]|jgi:hypothetical protein|nr:hypothetical protein [Bifidobacterium tibiigranuli]MCH3974936.1 hypothetical protein [Bifidobacterium tibiigranuli]MCH4189158.1 hypothetical protein [Bifidobacterium tibiigranuli]MCH4202696.1 hypothetical protein [Bifidobacterium tibiigranuli]MCH4273714.1 hypothetical protein [Bifidobacterium tibiigranuli]MCI1791207.1 hypothetical protein [Bifidobacterium tibiigranuli]